MSTVQQPVEDEVAPLEFRYKLDEIYHHDGKINNFSRMRLIKSILEGLTKEDQKALREGCLGPIVQMEERLQFSTKYVHFMLQKEVVTKKKMEMWFCVNNHLLRYSLIEFHRVTGLNCAKFPEYKGEDFDMQQVLGRKKCSIQELEELYEKEDKNSRYKFKMALLMILEGILMARDKINTVRQSNINLVHNLDRFNTYPWGRLVFQETLSWLRTGVNKDKKGYNLYGFPLAFQIWSFEALPGLASVIATIDNHDSAQLCLRWISNKANRRQPIYPQIQKTASLGLTTFKSVLGDELDEELGWNDEEEEEDDQIAEFLRRGCLMIKLVVDDIQVDGEPIAKGLDEVCDTTRKRRESDRISSDFVVESKKKKLAGEEKIKSIATKTKSKKKAKMRNHPVVPEKENSVHSIQRSTGGVIIQREMDVESIISSVLQKTGETEPLWAKRIRKRMDKLQTTQEILTKSIDAILHQQTNTMVTFENLEQQVVVVSRRLDRLNNALFMSHSQQKHFSSVPPEFTMTHQTQFAAEDGVDTHNDEDLPSTSKTSAEEKGRDEGKVETKGCTGRLSKPSKKPRTLFARERNKGCRKQKMLVAPKHNFISDLPAAPKNSLLSHEDREFFYKWYNSNCKANDCIKGYSRLCQKKWFSTILKEDGSLESDHIEEMLCLIRKAVVKYPENFHGVAVLPFWWTQLFNKAAYETFCMVGSSSYEFDDKLYKVVRGELPIPFGKSLYDVDRLYAPFNIENKYWVALEIHLSSWRITVFDSYVSSSKEIELQSLLEPLSVMFPEFLRKTGKFGRFTHTLSNRLPIARRLGLPSNVRSGSCGIYTVKYIEYLSSGRIGLTTISDDYVEAYREQIAYAILRKHWRWPFAKEDHM